MVIEEWHIPVELVNCNMKIFIHHIIVIAVVIK